MISKVLSYLWQIVLCRHFPHCEMPISISSGEVYRQNWRLIHEKYVYRIHVHMLWVVHKQPCKRTITYQKCVRWRQWKTWLLSSRTINNQKQECLHDHYFKLGESMVSGVTDCSNNEKNVVVPSLHHNRTILTVTPTWPLKKTPSSWENFDKKEYWLKW